MKGGLSSSVDLVLSHLRLNGVSAAQDMASRLKVSQPTLTRALNQCQPQVLKIGRARSTRYALRRDVPPLGNNWPIFSVGSDGIAENQGVLTALHRGQWHVEASASLAHLIRGDFHGGIFSGLPWFLADLRPQGFLGRAFARTHAAGLGAGLDPSLWTDDITLTSIVRFGGEALGNLVVGEPSYQQLIRHRTAAPLGIEDSKRSEAYPALAQAAIDGDLPGSSAGGEQPKFLAIIGEGESVRHALIKFSPHPDTPAGRRWFDLLLCEHLAACTLNDHGVPAARTALLETGGRLFLESTRFDRVGTQGRRGLFSLFSLSAAYYGRVDEPWKNLAKPLVWDDWISSEDAHRLRFMWRFGTLIGNSDMHHGNASFLWDGGARLTLAPSYDMLPMLYAPSPTGELVEHRFEPPVPEHDEHTIWNEAATLAVTFWQRVEAENRVSKGFRKTASENIVAIQKLQSRL